MIVVVCGNVHAYVNMSSSASLQNVYEDACSLLESYFYSDLSTPSQWWSLYIQVWSYMQLHSTPCAIYIYFTIHPWGLHLMEMFYIPFQLILALVYSLISLLFAYPFFPNFLAP